MKLAELDKLEKYLKSHGYICVRVDDTTPGHKDVAEILEKHGVKGTFFIITFVITYMLIRIAYTFSFMTCI